MPVTRPRFSFVYLLSFFGVLVLFFLSLTVGRPSSFVHHISLHLLDLLCISYLVSLVSQLTSIFYIYTIIYLFVVLPILLPLLKIMSSLCAKPLSERDQMLHHTRLAKSRVVPLVITLHHVLLSMGKILRLHCLS